MRPTVDLASVQRASPFGALDPKRRCLVRFEQIAPVIRIAHRQEHPLRIPERIIYDHELVLVLRGRGHFGIGGEHFDYAPGTLFFLPPFTAHEFCLPESGPGAHIAVHFDFCETVPGPSEAGRDGLPYEVSFPGAVRLSTATPLSPGHWIESVLRGIVDLNAADDSLSCTDASARLTMVLVQLLRWGRTREATGNSGVSDAVLQVNRRRVADAVAFIESNLCAGLPVESLARIAGLSRSRFASVFREIVGESAQRYVERRRIAEAGRLLADPALSVKEIAVAVGYDDPMYFSRAFRRVDGLSPSQYRAALFAAVALPEIDDPN